MQSKLVRPSETTLTGQSIDEVVVINNFRRAANQIDDAGKVDSIFHHDDVGAFNYTRRRETRYGSQIGYFPVKLRKLRTGGMHRGVRVQDFLSQLCDMLFNIFRKIAFRYTNSKIDVLGCHSTILWVWKCSLGTEWRQGLGRAREPSDLAINKIMPFFYWRVSHRTAVKSNLQEEGKYMI
jgi:hypothetical protein